MSHCPPRSRRLSPPLRCAAFALLALVALLAALPARASARAPLQTPLAATGRTSGGVLAWGLGGDGQTTVPPAAQSGVVAVAASTFVTVALRADGSVLAWGNNIYGQTTVPPAAQSGVVAIAAGGAHTV